MSIKLTHRALLESKGALDALGKVYLPVGKERYWFVKTLGKIQNALKHTMKAHNEESNRAIAAYGSVQTEGQMKGVLGIDNKDIEKMKLYQAEMDKFLDSNVSIDIKPITLAQLQDAQVTLQANDQVALMWLFTEED